MALDDTPLGYPLPHPDNSPRTVDVPRLRVALSMIDMHVAALQAQAGGLVSEKADKQQVAADIAAAIDQLKGDAPEAYDTLVEIAAKLADNDDVVASIMASLATKANAANVYSRASVDSLMADAALARLQLGESALRRSVFLGGR